MIFISNEKTTFFIKFRVTSESMKTHNYKKELFYMYLWAILCPDSDVSDKLSGEISWLCFSKNRFHIMLEVWRVGLWQTKLRKNFRLKINEILATPPQTVNHAHFPTISQSKGRFLLSKDHKYLFDFIYKLYMLALRILKESFCNPNLLYQCWYNKLKQKTIC